MKRIAILFFVIHLFAFGVAQAFVTPIAETAVKQLVDHQWKQFKAMIFGGDDD